MIKQILVIFVIFTTYISPQVKEVHPEWIKIADNLAFPEGPAWNDKYGLFASNCYSDWILNYNNDVVDTFVVQPTIPINFSKTNGLTFDSEDNLYACDFGLGAILKFDMTGKCDTLITGYNGNKFNRPNDLAFDNKGNLYFTDPKSYGKDILDGSLYKYNLVSETLTQVYTGLAFPNGIAFNLDYSQLYVCESAKSRILLFELDNSGKLKEPVYFAELPGGDPDGIAFDYEGNLYAAHFGGGAIYKIDPEGNILEKIITPGKKPSNIEFGGNDLKTLFITEDETNAIYKTNWEVEGLKLLR